MAFAEKREIELYEEIHNLERKLKDLEQSIVRCKECVHRLEYECPMYYVEEIPWDDDGYTEWDYVVHDNTCDEGFCHKGKRDYE